MTLISGYVIYPNMGPVSKKKVLLSLDAIDTVEAFSEFGTDSITITLRNGQSLAWCGTLEDFAQAVQAANTLPQVTLLPAKYNLVCKMLKDANDVLRSCAQVVNREGKSTDWPVLAQVLSQILREQHEYMVREKLLESAPDIRDLPAAF